MLIIGAPDIIDARDSHNWVTEGDFKTNQSLDRSSFASFKTKTAREIFIMSQVWKRELEGRAIAPVSELPQTFLYHVGGGKVPKVVKAPIENDSSERAWAAFMGLEKGFASEFAAFPNFCKRLISAWPGIFQWCRYFYDHRGVIEKDPTTIQTRIANCDLCLDADNPRSVHLFFFRSSAPKLGKRWTKSWLHRASSGGAPHVVSNAFLERLRTTINKSPMHADRASTLTFTLMSFIGLPRHPLSFAILADNAVWVVARMLFLVSQAIGLSPELSDNYFTCIRAGISFLGNTLVSLRFILRDILPKSMVYRSVVKVMKREHKELDTNVPDETVMRSYLREEWMSLVLLIYSRSTLAKFPKEIKGTGNVFCDCVKVGVSRLLALRKPIAVRQCDKSGRKSELCRCAGCLYVYYCSAVSQKEAWPVHREMCKLKKHSKDKDGHLLFSAQDKQFLRELFTTDAHIHRPHLLALAKCDFLDEPGENLIICIDYTNPQYPAGTCSLKIIKTYVFPPVSSDAADPANVQAQNDELIKMWVPITLWWFD
ncbi:hypothetical protein DFH09DRAFT_1447314 [Mycena vulgaris]|nr:hypothetical protein DFH09DRAFT_1447314 [Mycena vulgaris]